MPGIPNTFVRAAVFFMVFLSVQLNTSQLSAGCNEQISRDGGYFEDFLDGPYTDHKDGTVTDERTGLMWQQSNSSQTYDWDLACQYCDDLTLGGYTDWELPRLHQLETIADSGYYPTINTNYFPDTQDTYYWASDTTDYSDEVGWILFFYRALSYEWNKQNFAYARCVRGVRDASSKPTDVSEITLGLNLASWTQSPRNNAQLETGIDGLILHGAEWKKGLVDNDGYIDGNAIFSSQSYNHIGASSYIKLQVEAGSYPGGNRMEITAKPRGLPVSHLVTYDSGEAFDVVKDETWIYLRTKIQGTGDWTYTVSEGNYDDAGGTIKYSYSGTMDPEQLAVLESSEFTINFVNNHEGELTNLTLAEVFLKSDGIVNPDSDSDPDLNPEPDTDQHCTSRDLGNCQNRMECYFQGQGHWCQDTCSKTPCPVAVDRPQCAKYNETTTVFEIGCFTVGDNGDAYTADLSIYQAEPLLFELSNLQLLSTDSLDRDCGEYNSESNLLRLPCLSLGENTFSVDLEVKSLSPPLLKLAGFSDLGLQPEQAIKSIELDMNLGDPLAATIVDINNRYYRIYGVRDSNGELQYYDKLVMDEFDDTGKLQSYMTITFDENSRPTAFILADDKEKVEWEYVSDTKVKMTVSTEDGTRETVTMDNPFPAQAWTGKTVTRALKKTATRGLFEVNDDVSFIGYIYSCEEDSPPTAIVKRDFGGILESKYPILAKSFNARVTSWQDTYGEYAEGEAPDYSYFYQIAVPGDDFDAWATRCKGGAFLDTSFGFLGYWKDRPAAIISGLQAMHSDYKEGSLSNVAKFGADSLFDGITKGLPIISIGRKLYDYWNIEGAGVNGPCSKSVWGIARERLLHLQEIEITDGEVSLWTSYQPTLGQVVGADAQDVPDFDFSDKCEEEDNNSTEKITSAFDDYTSDQASDRWGIGPMAPGFNHIFSWLDVADYKSSGGNPNGYITFGGDRGDWWYFTTYSKKYAGNRSFAYGKKLTFDLKTEYNATNEQPSLAFVVLSGKDGVGNPIYLYQSQSNFAEPRGDVWTSYSINLDGSSGWWLSESDSLTRPVKAYPGDIEQVLSTLTSLRIRGEFGGYRYRGGLDNVVLGD